MKYAIGAAAIVVVVACCVGYVAYQHSISSHVRTALISAITADTGEKGRYFVDEASIAVSTSKDRAIVHDYLRLIQLTDQYSRNSAEDLRDLNADLRYIGGSRGQVCLDEVTRKQAYNLAVTAADLANCKTLIAEEQSEMTSRHAESDRRDKDEKFEKSEGQRLANNICRELGIPERYDKDGERAVFIQWKYSHQKDTQNNPPQ
jgi:hypothetical protein